MDDYGYSEKKMLFVFLSFRMEISRRKRLVRRITERLKRKPKKDRHKMPEQNLPEFPVQSQNPELTGDLTSVEETSPDDTKATEGLSHDKIIILS